MCRPVWIKAPPAASMWDAALSFCDGLVVATSLGLLGTIFHDLGLHTKEILEYNCNTVKKKCFIAAILFSQPKFSWKTTISQLSVTSPCKVQPRLYHPAATSDRGLTTPPPANDTMLIYCRISHAKANLPPGSRVSAYWSCLSIAAVTSSSASLSTMLSLCSW